MARHNPNIRPWKCVELSPWADWNRMVVSSRSAHCRANASRACNLKFKKVRSLRSPRLVNPYLLGHLDSHAIRQTQLSALMSKRSLAEKQQQGETRLAEVQTLQAKASYRQAMAKQAEIEAQKGRLDNLREAAELTHQQYETLLRLHQDDPELVTPHQLARQKQRSTWKLKQPDNWCPRQNSGCLREKTRARKTQAGKKSNIRY